MKKAIVKMKKPRSRKKASSADLFLRRIFMFMALIIYIVAIGLLFLPFINPLVVTYKNSELTYQIQSEFKDEKKSPETIKQPSLKDLLAYRGGHQKEAVGQFLYKDQLIDLPIYQELTENNLMAGVVAMRTDRDPLTENFAIIGHNFGYGHTLLSDMVNAKVGERITLNVLNETYHYEIDTISVVPETDVSVLDNTTSDKGILTVITCDTGDLTDKRLIVRGKLISHEQTITATQSEHKLIQEQKQQEVKWYSLKVCLSFILAIVIGTMIIYRLFKKN